jgi:hypothetical protein
MPRFRHRTARLERRRESETFGALMPIAWLIGAAGVIGLGGLGADYFIHGRWHDGFFTAAAGLAVIPLLLIAIRFLRGHFSSRLKDE